MRFRFVEFVVKVIRLRVREENRDPILDTLAEQDIDFITVPVNDDELVVEFPIPTDALGDVLDAAREAGLEDDYMVVLEALNAESRHMKELEDRYANDYTPLRLPELGAKAQDFSSDPRSYTAMLFLSAAIAAIGLLVDSPAVIVGSMVIAPLVGPVLTATVGMISGDRTMTAHSVRMQALGLGAAIVGAFAMAILIQVSGLAPAPLEISSVELISLRMAPTPLSILVGFAAGIVAAIGLTTKGTTSLIGVLIAAALVPAAAASGIGIAYGEPRIAVGSAGLLLAATVAVDIGMYATLRVLYRSQASYPELFTRTPSRTTVITIALVVLGVLAAGYVTAEQASFQQTVGEETGATLEQPPYTELGLVSIHYQYGGPVWFTGSPNITVAVTQPSDSSYPALPDRLTRRITNATGYDVGVSVQYQSTRSPTAPGSNTTARPGERKQYPFAHAGR